MSSSSEGEIKEGTVEEKKETITTTATKPEEPKRRVRRSRKEEVGEGRRERKEEQTMEVAKEKPTTAVVPTIPKRLLNRIDKHDTYLATIQKDVRLLNRELKKLTTRVNRIEARLVSLGARAKAKAKKVVGSSSSSKKKKVRTKR
jgi:translation initiation factor 2B subunit (eIF-2B alpha/beta/delta family)